MLDARYMEFESLSSVRTYVLGNKNWEDDFDGLAHYLSEGVHRSKCDDSYTGQLQRQCSGRDLGPLVGVGGRVAK